tara:strand:- start:833 stop:1033 length:201 start_codon:yes stop_codon:yes gene_type:complete
MKTHELLMYVNVVATSIAVALLVSSPSWGALFTVVGWSTAWYYYYASCRLVESLVEEGVLEEADDE